MYYVVEGFLFFFPWLNIDVATKQSGIMHASIMCRRSCNGLEPANPYYHLYAVFVVCNVKHY